jgi:hypothetical protein
MKTSYLKIVVFAGLLTMAGCDLQKDIEVTLPAYEKKLVVECYLEKDKPLRMTVSESASYFASPELPDVDYASVRISSNGKTNELKYKIDVDEKYRKAFNYSSDNLFEPQPNEEFQLEVTDTQGRKVTGKTKYLPLVPIKEVEWKYREDSLTAFLLIRFDDNPNIDNYYRLQVHKDSLNSNSELDFSLNDDFKTGSEITIGTGYNYEYGDTVYVTVYHIEKTFYDFLQSVESAANANGNPFAQPARVKSTVEGGIGVFTTLVYDRKRIVLD